MTVTLMIVAGALLGLGTWWCLLGPVLSRPTLYEELSVVTAAADTTAPAEAVTHHTGDADLVAVLRRRLRPSIISASLSPGLRADLDMIGLDPATYTARQIIITLAGLATAPLLAVLGTLAGAPIAVSGVLALIPGLGALALSARRTRAQATRARRAFLSAINAYLDLVAMRMASGAGIAQALREAVNVGDGRGWVRLRAALIDARREGKQPSVALGRLGQDVALSELVNLAHHIDHMIDTGAQGEATLRERAKALRAKLRIETHGRDAARNEAMTLGQFLLLGGYLILVVYPALVAILNL